MTIVVRPERPADIDAVRAVHRAAFGGDAEASLVDALRGDPGAWLPWGSEVAVVAGAATAPAARAGGPTEAIGVVIGHAVLSRLPVGGAPALALAPVAVVPDRQREGAGTALVRALLAVAASHSEQLVVVLGDPAYYRRFGFGPAAALGVTGPYGDGPEFQALLLPGTDPAVAPRGEAEYPSAFADA